MRMLSLLCSCFILFIVGTVTLLSNQIQPRFTYPVEGQLGVDFFLVNHVDQDPAPGKVRDYACGVQTYDGHQGTDFVLSSFRRMDSGVHVVASSRGRVIALVDSLPDRNKVSVVERGFGNYIAIEHPGNWISYYAHNRRNSALVRLGDTVETGQPIASVGSSGNSEDPHVHFEVWRVVDPFSGACSEPVSLWRNQPVYRTDVRVIDAGLTTYPPLLDTLRERPADVSRITQQDTAITAWVLAQGLRSTDRYRVEWRAPDGTLWFAFDSEAGRESNYMYWWSWIRRPTVNGLWNTVITINDKEAYRTQFVVEGVVGIAQSDENVIVSIVQQRDVLLIRSSDAVTAEVFDVRGNRVTDHNINPPVYAFQLPEHAGLYIVLIRRGSEILSRFAVVKPGM